MTTDRIMLPDSEILSGIIFILAAECGRFDFCGKKKSRTIFRVFYRKMALLQRVFPGQVGERISYPCSFSQKRVKSVLLPLHKCYSICVNISAADESTFSVLAGGEAFRRLKALEK